MAFLKAGNVVVTKVDKSILQKFNKEEDAKTYLASLKYWE